MSDTSNWTESEWIQWLVARVYELEKRVAHLEGTDK